MASFSSHESYVANGPGQSSEMANMLSSSGVNLRSSLRMTRADSAARVARQLVHRQLVHRQERRGPGSRRFGAAPSASAPARAAPGPRRHSVRRRTPHTWHKKRARRNRRALLNFVWPYGRLLPAARGEAVAAVDRLAATRAERDLGLAATARASRREHFTGPGREAAPAAAAATVGGAAAEVTALGLAGRAARGAASRFAELAIRVELLLTRAEDEFLVAVLANQGLVRCVQRTLLAHAASATRLSRREPLRGAIV